MFKYAKPQNRYFTDCITNGKLKNGHSKSKSFQSISNAMAEQWSNILQN